MSLFEKIVAIAKKNPVCLKDVVNSRQPANTMKKTTSSTQKRKGHKTSSKEVSISFSQKPKEAIKPSDKEINSVSLDDESAESESEFPQVREMIKNANDLAESSNAGRPSNWKWHSKMYYPNLEPGQFLVSLLTWCHQKQRRVLVVEKILEHFRFSHKWACMKTVVAWLLVVKHKDPCMKTPMVLYSIRQIYECLFSCQWKMHLSHFSIL